MAMEEIIDLNLEELTNSSSPSIGHGVELLMNDKRNKKTTITNTNNKEDVESLESELNNLTSSIGNDNNTNDVKHVNESIKESLFNKKNTPLNLNEPHGTSDYNNTVKIDENVTYIGDKTANQESSTNKTWDGFQQFNDIPTDPTNPAGEPKMSKDQTLREKFIYLKRLENLERRGVNLSQKYTIDSNLNEMKGEYEMIKTEKEKSNSVKFQAKMLMACVTGIEFLNNKFDPFDVNIEGWGETINENINDYDDVFAELHEKYQSKAKIAPELKLLFMLGGSAVMCHMTNTMFKSAMPGMDDILKQNPDLMKQFAGAAAQTMQKENTGFGNFMGDIMGGGGGGRANNGGSTNINDVGNMSGPSPNDFSRPSYNSRAEKMSSTGINISENQESFKPTQRPSSQSRTNHQVRPEMRGPSSNIKSLLSNIKKKDNNDATKIINKQSSINEVMFGANSSAPERTKRGTGNTSKKRATSEKNTIQLNI